MSEQRSYGARVSPLGGSGTILVKQTSREHPGSRNNRHKIDHDADGKEIFRHVKMSDTQGIAQAIRDALGSRLAEQPGAATSSPAMAISEQVFDKESF